jgi:RNA polymerase subunit RPABC4/transcription elongation factor Spt4
MAEKLKCPSCGSSDLKQKLSVFAIVFGVVAGSGLFFPGGLIPRLMTGHGVGLEELLPVCVCIGISAFYWNTHTWSCRACKGRFKAEPMCPSCGSQTIAKNMIAASLVRVGVLVFVGSGLLMVFTIGEKTGTWMRTAAVVGVGTLPLTIVAIILKRRYLCRDCGSRFFRF